MKTNIFFIACILGFQGLFAQNAKQIEGSYFKQCASFKISKPLRELAEQHSAAINSPLQFKEAADKERRFRKVERNNKTASFFEDPLRQKLNGARTLTPPIVNFEGQPGSSYPPDPTGAAGLNNYVQAVNVEYRAYDKSGNPVMAPLALDSLWPGSISLGDPIVMYDKFADRWFIQELSGYSKILIAISTSPDPAGTYYQYTFVPDSFDFPDFPKFSTCKI